MKRKRKLGEKRNDGEKRIEGEREIETRSQNKRGRAYSSLGFSVSSVQRYLVALNAGLILDTFDRESAFNAKW